MGIHLERLVILAGLESLLGSSRSHDLDLESRSTGKEQSAGERGDEIVVFSINVKEILLDSIELDPLLLDHIRQLLVESRIERRICLGHELHQGAIALGIASIHDVRVDAVELGGVGIRHAADFLDSLPHLGVNGLGLDLLGLEEVGQSSIAVRHADVLSHSDSGDAENSEDHDDCADDEDLGGIGHVLLPVKWKSSLEDAIKIRRIFLLVNWFEVQMILEG